MRKIGILMLALMLVFMVSCSKAPEDTAIEQTETTEETVEVENRVVTITVKDFGDMVLELYPEYAPETVANFIELAETKHYGRDSVQNKNDKPRKIKPTQKMVEIVNRFKGFKGIKLDDIESVEVGCYKPSDIFYRFSFKNRKHYLTIDKDSKYLPHN
jgi:biopolymer transport protein ExbD